MSYREKFRRGFIPQTEQVPQPGQLHPSGKIARRGAVAGTLLTMLLLTTGARLDAQNFERTFGRDDREIGRAIEQTLDGGFIAAGSTTDANNRQMAYVVRMRPDGTAIWERRFSVGGASTSGMDVQPLANGEHLLVGTMISSGSGIAHPYAIRFSDNGDLLWYRSYGDPAASQYATSVVETRVAKTGPDDIGNLVIAGYTLDDTGEQKGMLMRLWGNGSIRWAKQYDADPTVINDNELMSVDEALIGAAAGDIVATGFASMSSNGDDVWVLRVDGITGTLTTTVQGSATFSTKLRDRGNSIQELRLGAGAGDLIVAGESWGRPGTTNSEILMLETRPAPCDPAGPWAGMFQGDGGNVVNVARSVREISDSKLGKPGNVIVTGTSATKTFGPLSNDMFLQQYNQRTLTPASPHEIYGLKMDDDGYGVAVTTASPGYIATGLTTLTPTPPGHLTDLYVVRTGANLLSCTAASVSLSTQSVRLTMQCNSLNVTSPQWSILCSGESSGPNWGAIICE